jgi:vancomycin resistance protein VanJ
MRSKNKIRRGIWMANAIAIGVACWSLGVAVLINLLGDRWWIGTLVLFSPRWLLATPILVAALLWPFLAKSVKRAVLISGLVACWGVLGFCLPLGQLFASPTKTYRVLTCNVANWVGGTVRLERLIIDSRADIVMLQEYSDRPDFSLPGSWSSHSDGELLVASRYPLRNFSNVTRELNGRWPRAVGLFAEAVIPERSMSLYTLHLLSPRYGLSRIVDSQTGIAPSRRQLMVEETRKRESESQRVARAIDGQSGSYVVGGDFNMPVESYFFRKHWSCFRDAFSAAGFGIGNTCFVEKRGIHFGARVDHVLTRGRWHALRCWVGPDVGSDHRPLLADVYWQ